MSYSEHIPVLLDEVLATFEGMKLNRFVDATVGAGGHARALMEAHPEMHLIGFDQDTQTNPGFEVIRDNFRNLKKHITRPIDGILFDIGVSSMQLDTAERGFSYSKEAPLDMRMDPSNPLTASEIINAFSEEELTRIFRDYGELPAPYKLARRVIESRPLKTTTQLAKLLPFPKLAPLFQALRIAVNDELGAIEEGLLAAHDLLSPGGRMAVITFHSLEDRIVKEFFKSKSSKWEPDDNPYTGRREKTPTLNLLTRKPTAPSHAETRRNPRARSAKLRSAEKI